MLVAASRSTFERGGRWFGRRNAWTHAANNGQRLRTARALLPVRTGEATKLLATWAAEKKAVAPVLKKHLALLAH
ncbi:hypothetical protein [Nannocystis pusilla]|uniref:hypothetical protein n=1 Tax=Nannocystis pusilla TaxID=889268 RepID=UPI003DA1E10F